MQSFLVICRQNVGRSQMGEGFLRDFFRSDPGVSVISGGLDTRLNTLRLRSKYANHPHPDAVAVMGELGIDISQQRIKRVTRKVLKTAERVIVFTGKEDLPRYARKRKYLDKMVFMPVEDPAPGRIDEPDIEKLRETRDKIKQKIARIYEEHKDTKRERLSYFEKLGIPREKMVDGEPFVLAELGSGKPKIAITAATHGDEDIGVQIIADLQKNVKVSNGKGSVRLVVANTPALVEGKRFLTNDLNRAFPGKVDGVGEAGLAPKIGAIVKDADFVLDLHTASSETPAFAIIDAALTGTIELAEATGLEHIVHFPRVKKYAMVDFANCGIGLELGKDGSEQARIAGERAVRNTLARYGLTEESVSDEKQRKYYKIVGDVERKGGTNFLMEDSLKNFKLVKTGDPIGYDSLTGEVFRAEKDFYPVLITESYQGILCLQAVEVAREELMKMTNVDEKSK